MISFVQPSSVDIDNVSVPLAFPYIVAFLQGKPQHIDDDFSIKHPPMERGKRAKIFAPFDALDGYGDAVRSKNVIYTNKAELDESEKEELNRRLSILHNLTYNRRMAKKNRVVVSITYYVPCSDENNFAFGIQGEYRKAAGMVWRVDTDVAQTITLGTTTIQFQDITKIESEEHIFDRAWEDIC